MKQTTKLKLENVIRRLIREESARQNPTTHKMSKRNLARVFDTMGNEFDDYELAYREDGYSIKAASKLAHEKIRQKFPNHYDAWQEYLDRNNAGPYG